MFNAVKISNHMTYTLTYLIATVPMFLIFPICLKNFVSSKYIKYDLKRYIT